MNQGNFAIAKQSLEQALSKDFIVRETVAYHVLQAQILVNCLQFEEALKVSTQFHSCSSTQQIVKYFSFIPKLSLS